MNARQPQTEGNYRIEVRNPQGTVVKQCGHHHTTAADAARCLRNVAQYDDGTVKEKWRGVTVGTWDGSSVALEETHDAASNAAPPDPRRRLRFFRPRPPRG